MTSAVPFTVIGGYLGAGKTTLLNHLLSTMNDRRVAVLVNDSGSVNIDARLVKSRDGEVLNLANGCICCSLAGGFAEVLGRVRDRAAVLDHVIFEASGVSEPARLAEYGQAFGFALAGVVVVVDAERVRSLVEDKYVGDTVLHQIAQADVILLNKVDLVSAEERADLHAWLGQRAPRRRVIETRRATVTAEALLAGDDRHGRDRSVDRDATHADHGRQFESWTLESPHPLSRSAMEAFAAGLDADVYRAKGFVWLGDEPERRTVYQQVGDRWSLEPGAAWGDEPRRTQIVVVGRPGATTRAELQELLSRTPQKRNAS